MAWGRDVLNAYLSFHRRHIRSLGTLRRLEMVFFKLSIVSSLLTFSSNWPPVVGATVSEMTGKGGNNSDDDDDDDDELPGTADERWPQRQVGPAPALTAASVLSTTWWGRPCWWLAFWPSVVAVVDVVALEFLWPLSLLASSPDSIFFLLSFTF